MELKTLEQIQVMDEREAANYIATLTTEAESLVSEAETVADIHDLEFCIDIGGYGMNITRHSNGSYNTPNWSEREALGIHHHAIDVNRKKDL